MKRPRAALAVTFLLLSRTEASAQIVVDGVCTLADAIAAANTDSPVGSCAAGSGVDTIVVTVPVTLPAVDNSTDGPNGLPSVETDIIIQGNHFAIERSQSAGAFRILHVDTLGNLTLENATVRGGESPHGGGIFNLGTLNLINSTLSSNVATSTVGYAYARGGGLFNSGTATLTNSTIASNMTTSTPSYLSLGGGIYNRDGTLTLSNSTVSGNTASSPDVAYGGGITNFAGGTVNVTDSTISFNTVTSTFGFAAGGGVENQGALVLTNSTVSGNLVSAPGGGGFGGGIDAYGSGLGYLVSLVNSTVSTNFAVGYSDGIGGGIYSTVPLELTHATLAGNTATTTFAAGLGGNLFNPDVGGDTTSTLFSNGAPDDCFNPVVDLGGNFATDVSCLGVDTVILLDPALADNGGPTETHALLEGSPAIDAAGGCALPRDQRGAGRVMDCDSGAFEFIPCGTLVLSNRTVFGAETWEACLDAQLGENLFVESGGALTIAAGRSVSIVGPASFSGLTVILDPSLQISSPESLRLQGRDAAPQNPR